ncbi:MAG: DUF2397 family protein [Lentisphaeria bacterium]|jgi:hypothetical protein|nr:DUF2397 family protein [Lentisphaeria bacterium]
MAPDPRNSPSAADPSATVGADAVGLLVSRNRNVGNLLLADRAVIYLLILHRILLFRRDHELEPLHEDIYGAVRREQQDLGAEDYSPDLFRQDMAQLVEWQLLAERMEMERLRGYRDSRRRKFRYTLAEDARAFLEWLEERALADREMDEEDTRDVLEELCGALAELQRLLNKQGRSTAEEEDPRRVLYQLLRLEELTQQANARLADFNARLLAFAIGGYDPADARHVLAALDDFVNRFLRRIAELRGRIVEGIDGLLLERNQEKLRRCAEEMEDQRRRSPRLLRGNRDYQSQLGIPASLALFYADGGKLDRTCHRIAESAMQVWRKLHAHLRELERRNHRVEDLRDRIADIARLPEDAVPRDFLRRFVASAGMVCDPNEWDDGVLATPPQPRRDTRQATGRDVPPIRGKRHGDRPVASLDEQRLHELRDFFLDALGTIDEAGVAVSRGTYGRDEDAERIIELAKAGLLGDGRRLGRVGCLLKPLPDQPADLRFAQARLRFQDMLLQRRGN